MKKLYIKGLVLMMLTGAVLSGCAGEAKVDEPVAEVQAAAESQVVVEEAAPEIQKPEISVVASGQEIAINDLCTKLDTYDEYNIQVSDEQILSELLKEEYEGVQLKSHTVVATDESGSEGGKYDAIDTMVVHVDAGNPMEILSQTIDKTVQYKRETESGNWVKISEVCDKWNVNHKKLGGTVWKQETADGTVYIRLSSTLEFFYTNVNPEVKSTEDVVFDTTILTARVTEKDGEVNFERLSIFSGDVTDTGVITLTATFLDGSEETLVLNDYEKTEKAECPISDEEFSELMRTDAVAQMAY